MIATITNHISKGVQNFNDTTKNNVWWRANFNMPVKDFMADSSPFTRYSGAWNYLTETTSYDLSGFAPGLEICNGCAIFDFDNDGGTTYDIDTNLTVGWMDTNNSTVLYSIANGVNFTYSLPSGSYLEYWFAGNIGLRAGEIDTSDDYYFKASASGTPSISAVSTAVTFSNVPSVATTGTKGMVYVDGNYLAIINANNFLHRILGTDNGNVGGTPGFIWMDTSSNIHFIDSSGHDRQLPWKIKQFASFYNNGATGAEFAGTSKAGYMWMDNEFGQTHLAYIGYDGYKYLAGAGDYPYV